MASGSPERASGTHGARSASRSRAASSSVARGEPLLATPLPGEPRGAAPSLGSVPLVLAFAPPALVGLFAPVTSVDRLPPRRSITPPSLPLWRGHGVVPDGNAKNRPRDVPTLDHTPRTVPGRPDVPSTVGECPVLIGVEEDVRGSTRSVVDRSPRDDHEGRWSR